MQEPRLTDVTPTSDQPEQVPWRAVALFAGIVLALPWALSAPFHLDLVGMELFGVLALACMWVPALATLVVLLTVDRGRHAWRRVGLGVPGGRWGRWAGVMALALFVPIGISLAGPFLNAALGLVELDLVGFSGFRELLATQLEEAGLSVNEVLGGLSVETLVYLQLAMVVPGAFLNVLLGAWGEEIGWRGWLHHALSPLGRWPAYGLIGVLWGFWHAPLILLGHNYPDAPVLGVFLFVPFCVLTSVFFGWTRDVTGSVWPAALAHGALNASAGVGALVLAEGSELDMTLAAPVGLVGFILPGLLAVVLAVVQLLRRDGGGDVPVA